MEDIQTGLNKLLLIEHLLTKKDEEKKNHFNNLFTLNFIQSLVHLGGSDYTNELNGNNL